MSNLTNKQKATYALLANNVYWDVRSGFKNTELGEDFINSNWTPVPEGWTVLSVHNKISTTHILKQFRQITLYPSLAKTFHICSFPFLLEHSSNLAGSVGIRVCVLSVVEGININIFVEVT